MTTLSDYREEGRPIGIAPRLVLFCVLAAAGHFASMAVVREIVHQKPEMIEGWPAAVRMLCGPNAVLETDFTRAEDGQRRGLDEWILCGSAETRRETPGAGARAAYLAALPLSLPLAIGIAGLVFRNARYRPR